MRLVVVGTGLIGGSFALAAREAGLFEQVVFPMLRQRNPEARARARDALVELARAGRGLRSAYLRDAVDELLAD